MQPDHKAYLPRFHGSRSIRTTTNMQGTPPLLLLAELPSHSAATVRGDAGLTACSGNCSDAAVLVSADSACVPTLINFFAAGSAVCEAPRHPLRSKLLERLVASRCAVHEPFDLTNAYSTSANAVCLLDADPHLRRSCSDCAIISIAGALLELAASRARRPYAWSPSTPLLC